MKKKLLVLIMAGLLVAATGCGKEAEEDLVQSVVVENIGESEQESDISDISKEEGEESDVAKVEEPPENVSNAGNADTSQADLARDAYYSVVETLYKTYTLPDGTNLGYDEVSDLSWNQFAICDIDQDGEEELLIIWTSTYSAGMAGIVYGYDSASGSVKTELLEYPSLTFYNNGVVEAGLSHNQGLAGEIDGFWPYTLYRYDKDSDIYAVAAEVDAWNKAYYEKDYNDSPFPDDMDRDGDGILYKITTGGNEELMDLDAYKEWRNSFIGEAKKVEIPFEKMTEESIRKQA